MCKATVFGFSRAVWEWQIDTQSNRNCYIIVHTTERNLSGAQGCLKSGIKELLSVTLPVCMCMFIQCTLVFTTTCKSSCKISLSQPQIHPVAIPQLQKANQSWDSKTKHENRNSRASASSTFPCLRIFLIKPIAHSLCRQFSFLNLLWYCLLNSKAIIWLFCFCLGFICLFFFWFGLVLWVFLV